ncbi:Putative ribonuclease H protein At1g65750, partial [Linum perenne]
ASVPDHGSPHSWICVGENDIVTEVSNGVRALRLSQNFKEKLCKPWVNTVVIRLVGKSIGYSYLCNRLKSMWKPVGSMHVIDVDLNCFLVRFGDEKDYFRALTGGPWLILEHYLVVQQWDSSFRVSNKLPSKMVVWVRFPHLPIQLYHKQILSSLGNLIGKTVRMDYNTQTAERGKFARITVEIDINEPLVTGIMVDGVWQRTEYENLPDLCFTCEQRGIIPQKRKAEETAARSKIEGSKGKFNNGYSKDAGEGSPPPSSSTAKGKEGNKSAAVAYKERGIGPAKEPTLAHESEKNKTKHPPSSSSVRASGSKNGPSNAPSASQSSVRPSAGPMITDDGSISAPVSDPDPSCVAGNLFVSLQPPPSAELSPSPSLPIRQRFHRKTSPKTSSKLPAASKMVKVNGRRKAPSKGAKDLLLKEVLQNEKSKAEHLAPKASEAEIASPALHSDPHPLPEDMAIEKPPSMEPKFEGGLGLKKARELNEAYMMKLGWLILKAPEKLWVQVLTSKYLKNLSQGMTLRRKTGGSNLWKGIRKTWPTMAEACQHSIRDGTSTLFWQHRWLDSGDRLAEHAIQPLSDNELDRTVAEAVADNGDWNWDLLTELLPPQFLKQIAGMDTPNNSSGDDDMIWGPDPRGKFSISSAYEILASGQNSPDHNLWKKVWNWQGPNRVKYFLWLVAHNRLLNNAERQKCHMTDSGCCRLCPTMIEDSLHVLRDCKMVQSFWRDFLPPPAIASFFSGNLQDWLIHAISSAELGLSCWIAMWLLWKARNEDIFEGKSVTSTQLRLRVHSWIAGVRETMKSSSQILSEIVGRRRDTLIKWIPAPDEWITVNTDGSVTQPLSHAAGGGVIRNSHGAKLASFASNFGRCSIMRAELRAATLGLSLAWDMGFRKVNLQIDSLAAIAAIKGNPESDTRHGHTIQQVR